MSRKSALWVTSVAVISLAATIAVLRLQRYSTASASGAGSSTTTTHASTAPAQQQPQPTAQPTSADGVYVTVKGDNSPAHVRRYLPNSTILTSREFEAALKAANPDVKGIFPKPGTQLKIPGYAPMPWTEKSVPVARDFEVRAVYLTGLMAGSEKGQQIIRDWRAQGGNAVVFDVKDSDGSISVPIDHKLAPHQKGCALRNLPKFTRFVHSQGMHAIARIAIFRDELLVQEHPELAIQSRSHGGAWRENGKLVWTDPSHPEIWDYNIALAKYAAANGADEVQFDYVRFPAEGDQKDAKFHFESQHPDWKRSDVIVAFLQKAHEALKPTGVLFSLDVFGVMAWQRPVDLSHTGQDIPAMAKHCEVLSPMIYPSHFYGMDGYTMPGDAPEHFISTSMDRFAKVTAGTGVVLRPWLQAFGWKTKTYSPEYIRVQVSVAKQHGGNGFLFWNARNDYSKPFAAMPEMRKNDRYFRGEEVKDAAARLSAAAAKPAAPAQNSAPVQR
jgi:hypothetical protein